jgi:hypothetical protein
MHIQPATGAFVMPGLVPGIHALLAVFTAKKDVDGRDKPGHDDVDGPQR